MFFFMFDFELWCTLSSSTCFFMLFHDVYVELFMFYFYIFELWYILSMLNVIIYYWCNVIILFNAIFLPSFCFMMFFIARKRLVASVAMGTWSPNGRLFFWKNGEEKASSLGLATEEIATTSDPVARPTFWPFSYEMATKCVVANSMVICSGNSQIIILKMNQN